MYWQLSFFGGLGCRNYLREETIQGRKLITIRRPWLRKIFNEGKYSRVETIWENSRFESKYVVFISEKDRDSAREIALDNCCFQSLFPTNFSDRSSSLSCSLHFPAFLSWITKIRFALTRLLKRHPWWSFWWCNLQKRSFVSNTKCVSRLASPFFSE